MAIVIDAPSEPEVLWPAVTDPHGSVTGRFLQWLRAERGLTFDDYEALWAWSTTDVDAFWLSVRDFFDVRSSTDWGPVREGAMPGTRWFPGARLNYAEHLLRRTGDEVAVLARSQTRPDSRLTWDELRDAVARCRAGLQDLGVGPGDAVAAYLPNIPETLIGYLATASLGATWASCPPEFGERSVIDRLDQLRPTVLLACSGYRYGTKDIDRSAPLAAIRAALPSLQHVVEVPYGTAPVPDALPWQDLLARSAPLEFTPVPFDHPLHVLFSSGTTGQPKAIVQGHGGILLEHLKSLGLHTNLGPDDRYFVYTTTGWMMWNFLVSGLALGSAVVLFDGEPAHPDASGLWRVVADLRATRFDVGAAYLLGCRSAGLDPNTVGDLSALRGILSTGAPMPAEGFRWVHQHLPQARLASGSGGTDVCTALVGGSPIVPVVAGEISCRHLGCAVEAFDDAGQPVRNTPGEMVLTRPMPSMPLRFLGDDDGSRLHEAYFDRFDGVWSHRDWITITDRGSCVITGRSDATLNRGGVRLGTSEFYDVVEALPGVADSLVVHIEDEANGQLILFVRPQDGVRLDDALRRTIRTALREQLSPRHAPDELYEVASVPRIHSGKKLEVPVKRIIKGEKASDVASVDTLADPDSLRRIEEIAAARATPPTG